MKYFPRRYDVIVLFCGRQRNQFLTDYILSRFHGHSFNVVEVTKGEHIVPCPGYGWKTGFVKTNNKKLIRAQMQHKKVTKTQLFVAQLFWFLYLLVSG